MGGHERAESEHRLTSLMAARSDRPVALVTGASAGIGLAFAEALAKRGHHLVLTARRADRLAAHAERFTTMGLDVETVAADLAEADACSRIADAALNRFGRVDVLVNNAGYGLATRFGETDLETHRRFLEVLVAAPVELTHRLLPSMRARRSGRIIHVASLAAFAPEPAGSLYSAAKRFLVSFSRALDLELAGSGVRSTAVCPGFTYSEFHDVMGNRGHMSRLPRWLWQDACTVAESGLAAAERGKPVVITGLVNKAIAAICHVLPGPLLRLAAPRSLLDRHEHLDQPEKPRH